MELLQAVVQWTGAIRQAEMLGLALSPGLERTTLVHQLLGGWRGGLGDLEEDLLGNAVGQGTQHALPAGIRLHVQHLISIDGIGDCEDSLARLESCLQALIKVSMPPYMLTQ